MSLNISKLKILIMVGLLVGLAVGVYLVQFQQIFRSKAAVDLNQAFEIRDRDGKVINCSGTTCYTNSDQVQIKLKDKSLLE